MSQFRFEEFNPRRHMRGAEAARVTWVNDQGEEDTLWMSPADIRSNVLLHGPHYGLLVAASHYHMKADQLVALHRSKGKNKTFLQPMEPVRDQYGFWSHPDYPVAYAGGLTDANLDGFLKTIGFESERCAKEYEDVIEIPYWNPTRPSGDGWFVGTIRDTEDGAVCVWLRKLEVA